MRPLVPAEIAAELGETEQALLDAMQGAERVRDALIELGMPPELLEAEGFGATRPRDTRGTEDAMEANRRVEFVVTDRRAEISSIDEACSSAGASMACCFTRCAYPASLARKTFTRPEK